MMCWRSAPSSSAFNFCDRFARRRERELAATRMPQLLSLELRGHAVSSAPRAFVSVMGARKLDVETATARKPRQILGSARKGELLSPTAAGRWATGRGRSARRRRSRCTRRRRRRNGGRSAARSRQGDLGDELGARARGRSRPAIRRGRRPGDGHPIVGEHAGLAHGAARRLSALRQIGKGDLTFGVEARRAADEASCSRLLSSLELLAYWAGSRL